MKDRAETKIQPDTYYLVVKLDPRVVAMDDVNRVRDRVLASHPAVDAVAVHKSAPPLKGSKP